MSLQQMVEEIKVLTVEEMEALQNELDRERLMRSSHESAKRWAGQTFDFSEYPKSVELWSPFDESDTAKDMELYLDNATLEFEQKNLRDLPVKPEQPVIYMDLREYLPVPPRLTPEELEKDDVALGLEELQLMKLAEETAKRWAGMTIDLAMPPLPMSKSPRDMGGD